MGATANGSQSDIKQNERSSGPTRPERTDWIDRKDVDSGHYEQKQAAIIMIEFKVHFFDFEVNICIVLVF